MADKREILAAAMKDLYTLQKQGHLVVRSGEIDTVRIKALKEAGYLQPIMKGWSHLSDPASRPGDTTPWTMSYWAFVQKYCEHRFDSDWVLSPEICLDLHAGSQVPVAQVVIHAPKGGNSAVELPGQRSLFDLRVKGASGAGQENAVAERAEGLHTGGNADHMAENCYNTQAMSVAALMGRYRNVDILLRAVVDGAHMRL